MLRVREGLPWKAILENIPTCSLIENIGPTICRSSVKCVYLWLIFIGCRNWCTHPTWLVQFYSFNYTHRKRHEIDHRIFCVVPLLTQEARVKNYKSCKTHYNHCFLHDSTLLTRNSLFKFDTESALVYSRAFSECKCIWINIEIFP